MRSSPVVADRIRRFARRPVLVALVVTGVLLPLIVLSDHVWVLSPPGVPIEYGYFGPAGADLLLARWQQVFHVAAVQAGPFELLPYGLAYLLHLTGRTEWTVFFTVVTAALTFGVALLAHPGTDRGLRAAAVGPVCAILATAQTLLPTSVVIGHPAEIMIPLLWLAAARLARRDQAVAAGVVIALSAGFEVWGVLGAPVVLLAGRTRLLRPAAAAAAVLAVLYGPFAAGGDFAMFSFHWPVSPWSLFHAALPGATSFPWVLRLLQGAAAVLVGSLCALALRRSAWAPWLVVLSIIGTRLLLDPVLAAYYWYAPAVVVLALIALAATRRNLWVLSVAAGCDLACSVPVPPVVRAVLLLALTGSAVVAETVRIRRSDRSASTDATAPTAPMVVVPGVPTPA